MAKNNLTPQQDIATREFWALVASGESLFPGNPADWITLQKIVLKLLNYEVTTDGRYVEAGGRSSYRWGTNPADDRPDEWESDYQRALEACNEDDNSADTAASDSGEPSSDTPVREAVLSEDV